MFSFILNIGLALILGICIGLERQLRQRVAGLRTNALVALGAAVFMVMACRIGGDATGRIASYIISGIGFLGAGVILKDGASIRGLNTAATLWCTAAIGAFCGLGYIYEPIISTVLIISVHLLLRPLSVKIMKRSRLVDTESEEYHYKFIARCKESVENHVRVLFIQYIRNNNELMLHALSSYDAEAPSVAIIEAEIISMSKQDAEIEKIASFLTLEGGVSSIKWEVSNLKE
ncbi:MAG TPA: MgtC/SapB family protein [Petrimonas sp.]|uniref:MgtC/SapB family protein n=1 Tax=Petrimonas sp. TaxID=2023866 RepID=UPI000962D0F6|nr:MAG: magnesium transporter MgtC [Bacteroidia bacterium 43-41]HHV84532.1 MgtC/SapB family protein [Petrimonas sp.]